MDENDKTIITFECDEPEEEPVKVNPPANKVTPADAPEAKDPEPAAAVESSAEDVPPVTEAAPAVKASSVSGGSDSNYVTRKFLILCLAAAIVISTALGAALATLLDKDTAAPSGDHNSNLSESSLSKATGSELTIAEINDMNENSVVEIVVSGRTQNMFGQIEMTEGAGSGVIVNKDGYIVTNYHVIESADNVQVTLHNGNSYNASIVGGDNENDIAVLKINAKDLKPVTIGDSSTVDVGDLAVAIGNPLGQLGGTCTQGIISSLNRRLTVENRTLDLLQTDSAINPGNSGGGLFNSHGELIGIVESKTSGTGIEGLGFAIPINTVKDEINDLIDTGKISGKPAIGVTIYDVSEENAAYYNLESAGVYISEVTGDNAKKAGFKKGDRIISINGNEVTGSSDLIQRVRSCKIGDTVTVKVSRDGQEIEIKSVLEETYITD